MYVYLEQKLYREWIRKPTGQLVFYIAFQLELTFHYSVNIISEVKSMYHLKIVTFIMSSITIQHLRFSQDLSLEEKKIDISLLSG